MLAGSGVTGNDTHQAQAESLSRQGTVLERRADRSQMLPA